MASRTIRADTTLRLQAPRYEVVTTNYYLTNIPPLNNANLQVLSRNPITGEVQLTEKNSADFGTTVLNASIVGTSLIANPGTSNSHSLKTLRSTNSSINIIPSASEIDLQAQISLLNATPLGDAQVIQTAGTGSNFIFKSINAGSKINLLSDPNSITISTPGTIELQNRGAGSQIIHDPGIDDNFSLKSLVAGTNITLSSNDDEISINNTLTGLITQSNLGAGEPILSDPGTDSIFAFRTVQAGSNITLSSDPNTLIIGTTLTGNINQSNLGAGTSILSNPGTSNSFSYKTLVAGSNVTIGSDANTITLSTTPTPITQNNRGTGLGILSDPGVDADFSFKTLKAGPSITLTPTADDITIGTTLTGNITQANLGAGEILLNDPGTDNSFSFKSLIAGLNIALSSDSNQVTISTPLTGNITQTKLGSGEGLLGTFGTANSFGVKSLVAGSGIALSSTANEISISNTGSLVNVDLENIGTGLGLVSNPGVNNLFNFRSILAGTGIQILPSLSGDEYIISNDGSAVNVMLDNTTLSGEALLVDPGLNSSFHFKTLLAGTGVSLTSNANSITINSTGISSITQSNLGTGEPILSDPGMDSSFSFKTLVSNSSHITIGSDANTVTLDTDLTGQITQSNLGAGETILSDPGTDSSFGFKTLVAGSNINLISSPTTVTISTPSDGNITQSNLGLGEPILGNPGLSNAFNYKTLVAGTNMALASDANTVTINTSLTGNITQSNLGAGEPILSDPGTDNSFSYKTIVAGTNVTLASDANTLTISSIHPTDEITLGNLGTGEVILSDPGTDSSFNFKTIKPGTNMVLTSDANELTIGTTLSGNVTLSNLGAGSAIIHDPGTNDHFNLKSLVGGTNIGLTSDANTITINNLASGHITQSNLGSGEGILSDPGIDDTFAFKSLVAGTHMTVGSDANQITIGTTLTGNITLHAVGTGDNFLSDAGTDNDFSFKSIVGGSGIGILPAGNDIIISATQQNITQNNLGVGANILATPGTLSSFDFKTLIQGTGISISNGSNSITISSSITQSNIGIGTNLILKNPGTGINFDFKSIIAGAGILVTNGINDLTFASNISANNVGAGSGIVASTSTGSSLDFKSLIAGTGITLSAAATSITINATPSTGVTINNVGIGAGRVMKTTGLSTTFDVKSILAGTNINTVNGTDEITLNVPNTNLDNVGTGSGLLVNTGSLGVSSARNFKTLLAGTGITLSAGVNEITINASTQNSDMANLGAGTPILMTTGSLPVSTVRNFRTLAAGSNITLSTSADEITISATGGGVTPTSYGFSVELSNGAMPVLSVNPTYTTVAPYTTPAYGFNSGLLNTGTGVFTIGASDVGTYTVSFYIQVSNSNATASSKNYIDLIFRNTTTNTNYFGMTQDMPSNGKYPIGFTKVMSLTAGTYEMQLSKQRTGGTFTVFTTSNSTYSIYRIA